MTQALDLIGQTGLQYFGRTTASISHELKNALAIIKENAGLLNDYLLMADKGMPIDPARYKTVAGRIEDQTRRADMIIKSMNRFAHSIDHPSQSVDLNETLELLAALSHREAAMRQVTLNLCLQQNPVTVMTAPFLLLTLLGGCLTFLLNAVAPEGTMTLSVVLERAVCGIQFGQLDRLTGLPADKLPGEKEFVILKALGAVCHANEAAGTVLIAFEPIPRTAGLKT